MPRRIGRPGLIGTMARTAVVAGTASATVGAVNRRQAGKQQAAMEQQQTAQAAAESQAQLAQMQAEMDAMKAQQAAAAAPPPPPAGGGSDVIEELKKLGEMKQAGLLSDDEFAAAKAKLLG